MKINNNNNNLTKNNNYNKNCYLKKLKKLLIQNNNKKVSKKHKNLMAIQIKKIHKIAKPQKICLIFHKNCQEIIVNFKMANLLHCFLNYKIFLYPKNLLTQLYIIIIFDPSNNKNYIFNIWLITLSILTIKLIIIWINN